MHRQKQKSKGKRLDTDWSCREGSELLIIVNEAGMLSAAAPRLRKLRVHTGDVGFECRKESGWTLVPPSLTSLSMFISHSILIRFP